MVNHECFPTEGKRLTPEGQTMFLPAHGLPVKRPAFGGTLGGNQRLATIAFDNSFGACESQWVYESRKTCASVSSSVTSPGWNVREPS